jgi:predicted SAM-dependent methyltransferase
VNAVLLLDVLEHITHEKSVLGEVWRVLVPGGVLILSVPHKGIFTFLDPQNLKARFTGSEGVAMKHRHYSMGDLMELLSPRFRILRKHYGGLFLYPITFAAENFVRRHFQQDWSRFFKKLGDLDYDISWGRMSYNVILVAEKTNAS